jgi:hypothetical protein
LSRLSIGGIVAKAKVIYLRCTPETFKRWRLFIVKHDFSDYEEALNTLLDLAELYPHMIPVVKGAVRVEVSKKRVY